MWILALEYTFPRGRWTSAGKHQSPPVDLAGSSDCKTKSFTKGIHTSAKKMFLDSKMEADNNVKVKKIIFISWGLQNV